MTFRACVLLLLALSLVACDRDTAPPVSSLKLFIAEAGMYRLTRADLPGGFALDAPDRLQLTHRDSEIPLTVVQTNGDVEIVFYAQPDATPYSSSDVYWLTSAAAPAARMQTRTLSPPRADLRESAPATLRFEEDKQYIPTPIGGTRWFWDALSAPTQKTFTFNVRSPQHGDAQLQVALAGATVGAHRVLVRVNDVVVGEANWGGQTPYVLQATIANLRAGDNTLTLAAPSESEKAEVDFLDTLTLRYTRALVVQNDTLVFTGAQDFRVRAADGIVLYDISDPRAAQRLSGFSRAGDVLAFHDDLPQHRYLALAPRAYQKPLAIRAATPNNLRAREQRADMLIVAPAAFHDALAPLVQHRRAQGLQIALVDIEHIYDAFSDGVPDPHALRDFLRYAREQWMPPAPRFALLVGKASYDYRDHLNGPNKNLVPAYLLPTPHLGEAASDDWFAQADEHTFQPTLAIGRIPAKTTAQVSAVVQKIIAYDARPNADWQRRAVFVTDNQEAAFDARADALASGLPNVAAQKIYLSQYDGNVDAARADLIRQWNDGARLLTYIGHGSINLWAAGPLFSSDDVGALRNGERLPVLLTPTCLDGFFYHPQRDSLAEALLFKADGGIIAGLVPTGFSLPLPQDKLMQPLFDELFAQPAPTLGEAVLNAKRRVAASLGETSDKDDAADVREVLDTFVLLGDPVLKWK